jgi:CO dehydrogenase nickel-insertion accessory protein CooC1
MTSVTGLGGIGKSELARKYFSEHNKDYTDNVIWINADNYLTIAESFGRLAQDKLRISTTDENGKEKGIKLIVEDVYLFFFCKTCTDEVVLFLIKLESIKLLEKEKMKV